LNEGQMQYIIYATTLVPLLVTLSSVCFFCMHCHRGALLC